MALSSSTPVQASVFQHRMSISPPARTSSPLALESIQYTFALRAWRLQHFGPSTRNAKAADVLIRSGDGVEYPTRRLHLQYASAVLADLLEMPVQTDAAMESLPVLKMEEGSDVLDLLMGWCTPGARYGAPRPRYQDLIKALALSDKLDSSLLQHELSHALLPHLPRHAPEIFARAAALPLHALARAALASFYGGLRYDEEDELDDLAYSQQEDWNWLPRDKVTIGVSGVLVRLSEVPQDLVGEIPTELYLALVRCQERLIIDWRVYRPQHLLLEFDACWDRVYPDTR